MKLSRSILVCAFLLIGGPFIFIAAGQEKKGEKGAALTADSKQTGDQIEVKHSNEYVADNADRVDPANAAAESTACSPPA